MIPPINNQSTPQAAFAAFETRAGALSRSLTRALSVSVCVSVLVCSPSFEAGTFTDEAHWLPFLRFLFLALDPLALPFQLFF